MKTIYKFYACCGRMGYLDGLFVADSAEVESLIGTTVHFGEVLGKHSEISVVMEPKHFIAKSIEPAEVEMFERLDLKCGYNPFDYIEYNEDGEYD